jgi:hypothetical protein
VYHYTENNSTKKIEKTEYQTSYGKKLLELEYRTLNDYTVTSFVDSENTELFNSHLYKVGESIYRSIQPEASIHVKYNEGGLATERTLDLRENEPGVYNPYGISCST